MVHHLLGCGVRVPRAVTIGVLLVTCCPIYVSIYLCIYIYTHIRMHIYTHTHTHIYTSYLISNKMDDSVTV